MLIHVFQRHHFILERTLSPAARSLSSASSAPTTTPLTVQQQLLGLIQDDVILEEEHSVSVSLKPRETEEAIVVLEGSVPLAEWCYWNGKDVGQWVVVSDSL